MAADNYFQKTGPGYFPYHRNMLATKLPVGGSSENMLCPVFVQLKLRLYLGPSDPETARSNVQPTKLSNNGINLSQYCQLHKHYIFIVISYPAGSPSRLEREPLTVRHSEDITEVTITVDKRNIRNLFSKEYVDMLDEVKRYGAEMDQRPSKRQRTT
ncbi:hypothetical protein BGZ65_008848 [Modicella reniformis]|uniref:Uncharacterized protein n=1 Tax=Modicella reniformis TaxID=1440133 RepID=A0A9P6MAY4_9FUNG|nr:hypothetical protein BGZ65_008848 [Modicella reniformis]